MRIMVVSVQKKIRASSSDAVGQFFEIEKGKSGVLTSTNYSAALLEQLHLKHLTGCQKLFESDLHSNRINWIRQNLNDSERH
jgi:hypothetical protein